MPPGANLAIYGTGGAGEAFWRFLKQYRPDARVRCFVDSNQESEKAGLPVVRPTSHVLDTVAVIVVCSFRHAEIVQLLESIGRRNYVVYGDPGPEAEIYFSQYFAYLKNALEERGLAYAPLTGAFLELRKAAYLQWMLARLQARCLQGRTNIVTGICWLGEQDRQDTLASMKHDSAYADIWQQLGEVNLIGFDPDAFPRSTLDDMLYDHWSDEAMQCVAQLSKTHHVITTIANAMQVRGMSQDNITYLCPEQITATIVHTLLPLATDFIAKASRGTLPQQHLMVFGMSSSITMNAVSDMVKKHFTPAKLTGRDVYFRAYLGEHSLRDALKRLVGCRGTLGDVGLVLTSSLYTSLERTGLVNALKMMNITCGVIDTRAMLRQCFKELLAEYLRTKTS